MAGSRTLKLSILGDVSDLNKSLTTAGKDVDTFGDKVGTAGKAIGVAFAAAAVAAGAAAIKIGVDSVQAAIADEKAQTQLATAIKAATGATNAQITAIEAQITKTSLATGVADDQLRPALGRLVLATNSTKDAQALLNTALDVSAATGKPLETVTNALAKAYEGNTTSLAKLGVGYGAAELKGKDFNTIANELSTTFAGAALTSAGTYQGQIDKLKVAFDETKESLGVALLPVLQTFLTFVSEKIMPVVMSLVAGFNGKEGSLNAGLIAFVDTIKTVATPVFEGFINAFGFIKDAIEANKASFQSFVEVVKVVAPVVGTLLGGVVTALGKIASVVLSIIGKVAGAIAPIINTAIDGINLVIRGLNLIKGGEDIATIKKIGATVNSGGVSGTTPGGQSFGGAGLIVPKVSASGVITTSATTAGTTAATSGGGGGVSTAAKVAATAAAAATNVVTNGFNAGSFRAAEAANMPTTTINLTVNGAMDREGTARTIVETLNDSYYRGTGGASSLQIA